MHVIVVDTNIIISALLKNSITREILSSYGFNFIFPEYGLEEIYSYKNYIMEKTGMNEIEFDRLMLRIFKYVKLIPLQIIKRFWNPAGEIIKHIDEKDTAFIATALAFNCPIWSDDNHFKMQDVIKTYNTKEIMKFLPH